MGGATLYKVLDEQGRACHGGTGQWHLPMGKRPGKWMPIIADPQPCERGYHVVTRSQLLHWWLGPRIFVVEVRGDSVRRADKSAWAQARLVRETAWTPEAARLFACDCAERVLPLYERVYPSDPRPRQAIAIARAYANGQATSEQLDAARDATKAARAAAWAAAGAAAWAAWDAAGAAAGAAWDAAWDAAGAAAGAAERRWQAQRLRRYL